MVMQDPNNKYPPSYNKLMPTSPMPRPRLSSQSWLIYKEDIVNWLYECSDLNEVEARKVKWYKPHIRYKLRAIAKSQRVQAHIIEQGGLTSQSPEIPN